MSDLQFTHIGAAKIPLKGLDKEWKIVKLETIGKDGSLQPIGEFSLTDILVALNSPDGVPARVEEAKCVGHPCFHKPKGE